MFEGEMDEYQRHQEDRLREIASFDEPKGLRGRRTLMGVQESGIRVEEGDWRIRWVRG
jgi:hypothetical protein